MGVSYTHSRNTGVRAVVNALVHEVCVERLNRVVKLYEILANPLTVRNVSFGPHQASTMGITFEQSYSSWTGGELSLGLHVGNDDMVNVGIGIVS